MMLGKSDYDPLAPHRQRSVAPSWIVIGHKGDVDRGVGEIGEQMVARSVDQVRLHIREAMSVFEERGPEIAGRKRGVDADGKSTALASRASLESSGNRLCFFDDAPGGAEEFLAFYGWPGATVGTLEEGGA